MGTVAADGGDGGESLDELERVKTRLAEVTERFNELRARVANAWLTKDFNVLYRATHGLLLAVGDGDERKVAASLNETAAQLERLAPAYAETEAMKGLLRAQAVLASAIQAADAERAPR